MNKKNTILVLISLVAIVGIFYFARKNQIPIDLNPVLFYGNTCPHCKEVEKFVDDNGIRDKLKLVEKEVYDNRANAQEMLKRAESCGLPTDNLGVPFLYADSQCFVGIPEVNNYLAKKAGVEVKTSASPSASLNP
jgi:glutaredoxin